MFHASDFCFAQLIIFLATFFYKKFIVKILLGGGGSLSLRVFLKILRLVYCT
jgi:hypothetical protein